jgi:hypothetical protein
LSERGSKPRYDDRHDELGRELGELEEIAKLYEAELARKGLPGHQGRLQQRRQAVLEWVDRVHALRHAGRVTDRYIEQHLQSKALIEATRNSLASDGKDRAPRPYRARKRVLRPPGRPGQDAK